MTEKATKPNWLKKTDEFEARAFWGIDATAGSLELDSCGGGYPPKGPLPVLVWLRVFLDAKLHVPAEKLGAALAYEMDLLPIQRKKLMFHGITKNAEDPKIYKFSDILTTKATSLIPFKRTWTVHLQDVRKAPRLLDGQASRIPPQLLNLVKETLKYIATEDDSCLWKRDADDEDIKWTPPVYSTSYRGDKLTQLVLDNMLIKNHHTGSNGAKRPPKSMVRKAITKLVLFQQIKQPPVSPDA